MSAIQHLRAATGHDHEAVDAAFSHFDLADRVSYTAFLEAHARAVPAVEAALAGTAGPPPLRPRAPLLIADLAALGHAPPAPATIAPPASPAEAWGMAYVLEGSRLGGGLLARRVEAGLPHAYLSDVHLPGEWRGFMTALDEALTEAAARETAIAAARRVFALYAMTVEAGHAAVQVSG